MKTYTNNQGLELKINKFSSGQFKWAANVKDRFDPLTEENIFISRFRTPPPADPRWKFLIRAEAHT